MVFKSFIFLFNRAVDMQVMVFVFCYALIMVDVLSPERPSLYHPL